MGFAAPRSISALLFAPGNCFHPHAGLFLSEDQVAVNALRAVGAGVARNGFAVVVGKLAGRKGETHVNCLLLGVFAASSKVARRRDDADCAAR